MLSPDYAFPYRSLVVVDAPWARAPVRTPDSMSSDVASLQLVSDAEGEIAYGGVAKLPSGKLVKRADGGSFSLFGIFDGHNGYEAAEYLQSHIKDRVAERLPISSSVPPRDTPAFEEYLCKLRRALASALVACETDFAQMGVPSGATASLVLVVEDIATVCNLGDSTVFFDSGTELFRASVDHHVGTNPEELDRLRTLGAQCAPLHCSLQRPLQEGETGGLGPVRVWPGGLALSRAFADFDASEGVISAPFIMQIRLPATGGRFYMASDGIWGAWQSLDETRLFLGKQRKVEAGIAVTNMLKRMYFKTGLKDDCSVIVIDIMQGHNTSFVQVANEVKKTSVPSSAAASLHGFTPGATLPLINHGMATGTDYGSVWPQARYYPRTESDCEFAAFLRNVKAQAREIWEVAERGDSIESIRALRKAICI